MCGLHVCPQVVTAEGSPVVLVDQNATNGVIHVLDRVMLPPLGNIPGIVTRDPRFKTLLKAVGVAGLVPTLSGDGPFTVFAPTDEAFAKIPAATLNALLADKAKLTKVSRLVIVDLFVVGMEFSCAAVISKLFNDNGMYCTME